MAHPFSIHHREIHRHGRTGWLRAGVLGVNDGLVSTASLLTGVAASSASRSAVLTAGLAGLVAGGMSMAVGEYVSVASQRDTERADIARERRELVADPEHERRELVGIYERRGLPEPLAEQVAAQLMEVDPLGAHLRDELGLTEHNMARPVQAASVSASSFVAGSSVPVIATALSPFSARIAVIMVVTLLMLAGSGTVAARIGGAPRRHGAARLVIGGAVALAVTYLIGRLVGVAVD